MIKIAKKMSRKHINVKKQNPIALLPIAVFLVLYLGLGILFEYVMKIPMGFYNVPIIIAFLVAILVACLQNRSVKFDQKLEIMAQGLADKNIITMLLIFLTAGAFVGVVGRSSAESVAYFMLSLIPARFAVMVLFVVACFVSIAMGTSVGTITLIVPIAAAVSDASGFGLPLCIGSVMGGAMFGDNLSFISDTTIAACNGQGCQMKDKFRENFFIALPAAVMTLVVIAILSFRTDIAGAVSQEYHLLQIVPYILVLIGGIAGINVFVVLIIGIISGTVIMLATGNTAPYDLLTNMGSGASGMFETCMVAVLVAAMCALIREYGGFDALLSGIYRTFRGKRGGLLGMGLLVGLIDIATANNTVAIVMANPIAKEMAQKYDITPRKTASILDTFSCIFQGMIPYGAQMLVAISAVHELGHDVSAFNILPYLFYKTDNGEVRVEILLYQENLWLTQAKMAELFEVQKAAISKHLKNIFTSGELQEEAVVSKMETTAADGKRYNTSYYNLDAIIAVGYRVNSKKATMFRIWANRVLKEFIIKGYVIKSLNLLLFPSVLPIILASSI
jgi:Na+/H+ antiporter NhaC